MNGLLIAMILLGLALIAIHAFAVMRFVQVTRDLSKGILKPTGALAELLGGLGLLVLALAILITWVFVGWGVYLHVTSQAFGPPPELVLLFFPIPYVICEILINIGFDFD